MAGYFVRKKESPFSQVSNAALRDPELSLRAKGLYCVIQSYILIPDFTLYKSHLQQITQLGPKAFDGDWNELKRAGYLKQARIRTETGFVYEYELLDQPDLERPSTVNVGLDGNVVSTGNGASSTQDGAFFETKIEPAPTEDGSNSDENFEPTPLRTGFKSNPGSKQGDINNNDSNNTYEEIDRVSDCAAAQKEELVDSEGETAESQQAAIAQELRDYVTAHGKLPDYLWASRARCTEGIHLLTRDDGAVGGDPLRLEAGQLFERSLIQMCLTPKPMTLSGETVTAADVIERINASIRPDTGGGFGFTPVMDRTLDTYCHAVITTNVQKGSAYMKTCIWSELCRYSAQEDEPAPTDAEPADDAAVRRNIRAYLLRNHELPYEILCSENQCTEAIHLLTYYEQGYSGNSLTQAAFELFNYSLIQMLMSDKPLNPRGAYVTSAKVWEKLNQCISFSNDPHFPFALEIMGDVIDDYRQAEMKQAARKQQIKNRVSYMQSCIWSRLVTYRVSDGVMQEQLELAE